MEVIPSIDLRGGRCVRLFQGDYRRETVFSEDPLAVAHAWRDQGHPASTSSTWTERLRESPPT